jgi:hypothetical protein
MRPKAADRAVDCNDENSCRQENCRMERKLIQSSQQTNKLRGLSPRANYTDRATAACYLKIVACWGYCL